MSKISIKRKIQRSMIVANLITLAITMGVIMIVTQLTYAPIGYYMTKSATFEFLKRYEIAVADTAMKSQTNHSFMQNYTLDEVAANLQTMIDEEESIPMDMAIESIEMEDAAIIAKSEDDYKRIMVLTKEVYENSNQFGIDLSLIQIKTTIDDHILTIPSEAKTQTDFAPNEELQKFASNEIIIQDASGNAIGSVLFELNPKLFEMLVVLVVIFLILLALLSIFIVKLVSKLMSNGIVKPIYIMNRQLKQMSDNESIETQQAKLEMKKPPVEIKEMMGYSNRIMERHQAFNHQLELQNEELQMQNDELVRNREIIESQSNQLIQSEKMASIGQIAAAVVHEINTPIGAIKSNAQMLDMAIAQVEKLEPSEPMQKKLTLMKSTSGLIGEASTRIIEIVRSIKNFSRIDQSEFKDADLHEAIDSVLILTTNLWKSRIVVEKDYGSIPPVNCYIGLINQVVMNLVVNAIDAIEDTGNITIKTGTENDSVFISVTDTGTGIAPEILDKIFKQGFTTKPMGAGSGLGLALSKEIMEKHQGHITVDSTLGVGSTFTVWLPIKAPDTSF